MISNLGFYRQWRATRKAGMKNYIISKFKCAGKYGVLIYLGLFSGQIVFIKRIYPMWFVYALIVSIGILILSIVAEWKYNEYRFKNVLQSYKAIK